MRYILLFVLVFCFSCNNEKVIKLPEINHSEITEINDISAAYLFYDKIQKDSVELNRKNLISTTNWLVNVDKRLTLKQAIPHIKFLQEKKKNAGHKNKNAKNYFTCHDTSKNDLGFVEFTDVVYNTINPKDFIVLSDIPFFSYTQIKFNSLEDINLLLINDNKHEKKTSLLDLHKDLNYLIIKENIAYEIILNFNKNLNFQDYITIKSKLSELNLENISILNNEFIY